MRLFRVFPVLLLLICTMVARAQLTAVDIQTQTPLPQNGHDYVQWLNETVNPSNGQLSLKINVPLASGRQLSLPFNITYNSGQVLTGLGLGFSNNVAHNFSKVGWTYTIPAWTYQAGEYDDPDWGPLFLD
jgi:hypothetical protein